MARKLPATTTAKIGKHIRTGCDRGRRTFCRRRRRRNTRTSTRRQAQREIDNNNIYERIRSGPPKIRVSDPAADLLSLYTGVDLTGPQFIYRSINHGSVFRSVNYLPFCELFMQHTIANRNHPPSTPFRSIGSLPSPEITFPGLRVDHADLYAGYRFIPSLNQKF